MNMNQENQNNTNIGKKAEDAKMTEKDYRQLSNTLLKENRQLSSDIRRLKLYQQISLLTLKLTQKAEKAFQPKKSYDEREVLESLILVLIVAIQKTIAEFATILPFLLQHNQRRIKHNLNVLEKAHKDIVSGPKFK